MTAGAMTATADQGAISGGRGDWQVRMKKGLGLAGVGVAVGAAVAIPAAAANAAPLSGSPAYNSTATAEAGYVSVGGNEVVPDNVVTATDNASPQNQSLGLSTVESKLSGVPTLGSALISALKASAPNGASLVTVAATADRSGTSTACAGFLAGACTTDGQPVPITIKLGLSDLSALTGVNLPLSIPGTSSGTSSGGSSSSGSSGSSSSGGSSGLPVSLPSLPVSLPTLPVSLPLLGGKSSTPGASSSKSTSTSGGGSSNSTSTIPLTGYSVVLTLSGPEAACTAGAPGSAAGNFTATQSLATASVDIENNGKSILPDGPVQLSLGNVLSQVVSKLPANPLSSVLSEFPSALASSPLGVTIDPGSTSGVGKGPETTATAGELDLTAAGTPVLDIAGAKVTCGENQQAATVATAPSPKPTTVTATAPETALSGIQTDEGMYVPPTRNSDSGLWAGLGAAGVALVGGVGGVMLRRRLLHRS
jgi:hypothetical protein